MERSLRRWVGTAGAVGCWQQSSRRHLLFAVLLFAAVQQAGCSLAYVKSAPANPRPGQKIDCTDTYESPIADVIFTGAYAALAVFLANEASVDDADRCEYCLRSDFYEGAAIVSGITSAAFAGSAVLGFVLVPECAEARSKVEVGVRNPIPEVRSPNP